MADPAPIPHDVIIAGLAAVAPGHTVRVTWAFADKPNRTITWEGRYMGLEAGKAKVFYWKGQEGFPTKLKRNAPGIEVLMPREDVVYTDIKWSQAVQAGPEELREAIEADDEVVNEKESFFQGRLEDNMGDVAEWHIEIPNDARIVRAEAAMLVGYSAHNATPRIQLAWRGFSEWLEICVEVQGWNEIPQITAMGNTAFRSLRQAIAEDMLHIRGSEISAKMGEEDHPNDPFGKVLSTCRRDSRGRGGYGRGRGGSARTGRYKCDRCNSTFHSTDRCYAKNPVSTWQGGDKGTGKK
jgi:hypothetical protein